MIHIDQQRCKACGLCGRVCPRYVVETVERDAQPVTQVNPERQDICIDCAQCMAVCRRGAIRVDGTSPEDLIPVPRMACTPEQLMSVLQHRRSVRRFKDRPVPREVLDRIVEAVRWSPTATSSGATGITIVDRPEVLQQMSEHMYGLYERLVGAMDSPMSRFFVRRKMDERKWHTVKDFLVPGLRWYVRWYREGSSNEILRDAPAIMLLHAPIYDPAADESCVIAAWQAVLMAETLGLGTVFNGMLPPVCNKSAGLRELLGLGEDREVFTGLCLGYPRYKFKHTIRRRLAEVRYL